MFRSLIALGLLISGSVATAQVPARPRLLVVISVDQFSADLFAEYRPFWSGGLKRLSDGVVFPSGYQSHAATETCPGHSTILTGDRPSRTGIIANGWIDQNSGRANPGVYCAEDETLGPSPKAGDYVPSPVHLRVPTLGDRMKSADPRSRVVAVSGKDRAAIMMGGHATDEIWWLRPTDYAGFETLRTHMGRPPLSVPKANAAIQSMLAKAAPPMPLPTQCASRSRPVAITPGNSVGDGRYARAAQDKKAFRASPESDAATLSLASDLIAELKLGQGPATDLIAIGVSATDIVGHTYGTEGSEMCMQLATLDTLLGKFLDRLDKRRIDYAVVLTADHGGHDTPERNREDAVPDDQRVDAALTPAQVGKAIGVDLLGAEASGDVWVSRTVAVADRAAAIAKAKAAYLAHPQVATVLTAADIAATPMPTMPPETWTLAQRAAASYVPGRSGDLVVLLKPRVTAIGGPSAGYIATHGSPWDYDRRVPILFWRKGLAGFEQPNSVETVDIAPTLAAWIGLPLASGEMDGRCLDLIAGPGSLCP